MIEESLIQYGAIGIFCTYLIYDKQVLMKKIVNVLEKLASRIEHCPQQTTKTQYL